VDVCKSCRIFIGPCESSVSIRNCDDCTLVVACQQYRIRDCKNLKTLLYVGGDPALETSEGSEFGCFQYSYFTLAEQFAKAKLSVHNNQWSRVHDFGGGTGQKSSWKIMSQAESSPLEILKRVSELSDAISKEEEEAYEEHPVVPPTWGRRAPSTAENGSLVLFWSTEAAQKFYSVMSAYNKTHEEHPLLMVETQEALVTADQVKQVVGNAPAGRPITAAGGAIGVEVCMEGPEASAALAEVLAATGLLDGEGYYASEAPGGKDVQVWFQQMQESRGICFVTGSVRAPAAKTRAPPKAAVAGGGGDPDGSKACTIQ